MSARRITLDDVRPLARGCAILGTGGGGDVSTSTLAAERALKDYGDVPLVTLDELPRDGLVLPLGSIGAPTVSQEMLMSGREPRLIREAAERDQGRPAVAVMASEIGGGNGVEPVAWAATLGLPLLDADGMGRAFPEVQMVSMYVAGLPAGTVVLADVQDNLTLIRPVDGLWSEQLARAVCVASGATALMADYIHTPAELAGAVIEGSVSRALAIGRAVSDTQDPIGALVRTLGAATLITGKIIELERHTGGGFVRGSVVVDGVGECRGRMLRVEIQNENLVALENGVVRASVPDLITLVDAQTAEAVSTESLGYGQRVTVLAWPCAPLWRTPAGLRTAGPAAFGYDIPYIPVEEAAHANV
ncbi:DUF917 domain-containing protein [Rhizohabitans arisaemae]|uniref:DUF917 domain-containing protein n=1 Tax=Rhizohabitans arisaemae TaxID=2720610 RepID=UPI0024B23284|nr:DUF917 domain-containing protein [Rhizohabitans arisaemae]